MSFTCRSTDIWVFVFIQKHFHPERKGELAFGYQFARDSRTYNSKVARVTIQLCSWRCDILLDVQFETTRKVHYY